MERLKKAAELAVSFRSGVAPPFPRSSGQAGPKYDPIIPNIGAEVNPLISDLRHTPQLRLVLLCDLHYNRG